MNITIKNEITGLLNNIEFKLFEQFKNQNEYMEYLINAMNMNIDSIIHIKSKTQQYFANEHIKLYLFENGFLEDMMQDSTIKRIAEIDYFDMMSTICLDTCMIHYKQTLLPDSIRRKKLANEYEQTILKNIL